MGLAVLGGLVQIVCVLWLGGLGGCIPGSDTDACQAVHLAVQTVEAVEAVLMLQSEAE